MFSLTRQKKNGCGKDSSPRPTSSTLTFRPLGIPVFKFLNFRQNRNSDPILNVWFGLKAEDSSVNVIYLGGSKAQEQLPDHQLL